jgi:hypothetical protein
MVPVAFRPFAIYHCMSNTGRAAVDQRVEVEQHKVGGRTGHSTVIENVAAKLA